MGRYALIVVAGFAIIYGIMRLNLNRVSSSTAMLASEKYEYTSAKDLANSATSLCLYNLALDPGWRQGVPSTQMYGGVAQAQVTTVGIDCVMIASTGTVGDTTAHVNALVKVGGGDMFPGHVQAVISAQTDVGANGDIIIDGRDHLIDPPDFEAISPGTGVYAIRTTPENLVERFGSCTLGGTDSLGNDVEPTKDPNVWIQVVDTAFTYANGFPSSPDSVMGGIDNGFPEGTLKEIAQSGYNGSQYVTDPDSLRWPLHGVTYVELPDWGIWNSVDMGDQSEGILIVHNQGHNALLKNTNGGRFTGIMIVDDYNHCHHDVLGLVFVLTPNPPWGNVLGNSSGWIYYSRQAIKQAIHESGADPLVDILSYWE